MNDEDVDLSHDQIVGKAHLTVMKDCRPMVLSRFNDVQRNTVDLLRRTDQLRPLVRRLLIEESTQELNPPEALLKQALANHCQQEQLNNEEALEGWLSERFISRDELLLQLSLPSSSANWLSILLAPNQKLDFFNAKKG